MKNRRLEVRKTFNESLLIYETTIQDVVERIDITGLEPETSYTYRVGDESATVRTFASFTQSTLRVGFGSCSTSCITHFVKNTLKQHALNTGTSGSTSSVFREIANQDLDLFIHLGDMHYEDISVNSTERFLDAFDIVHASSTQTELFRSVPFVYMYDDHDFGPNNADMTSMSRDAAVRNYRRCVPHYPLERSSQDNEALYHAFTIGRVRFVVPDLKSEMLNDGSMMSSTQMDWFLSEIRNANKYALVVLVLGVPWISDYSGWGSHQDDRSNISNTILEMYRNHTSSSLGGHANIVGLAGDAHSMAFDDGMNSAGNFPMIQAAPLEQIGRTKGGFYTSGCYGYGASYVTQYAIIEIIDSGISGPQSICIDLELRRVGDSSPTYETSFCGPFINTSRSNDSMSRKKCEIDLFPSHEMLEMVFSGLFVGVATLIVIARYVWMYRINCRETSDDGVFLLWNLMLGYVWIGITFWILYVGLEYRGFRTNPPVYLARTGFVAFVPLTILFVSILIIVVQGKSGSKETAASYRDIEIAKKSRKTV